MCSLWLTYNIISSALKLVTAIKVTFLVLCVDSSKASLYQDRKYHLYQPNTQCDWHLDTGFVFFLANKKHSIHTEILKTIIFEVLNSVQCLHKWHLRTFFSDWVSARNPNTVQTACDNGGGEGESLRMWYAILDGLMLPTAKPRTQSQESTIVACVWSMKSHPAWSLCHLSLRVAQWYLCNKSLNYWRQQRNGVSESEEGDRKRVIEGWARVKL